MVIIGVYLKISGLPDEAILGQYFKYRFLGRFPFSQFFSVGDFGNVPCQMERLFSSSSKLAISLADQKTYMMAQEDYKMEIVILISVPIGWNGRSGEPSKIVHLFRKFPINLRVPFVFQPVIPEFW